MPHSSGILSAWQRRDGIDKLMFGWVRAGQRLMPGVSVERLLEAFVREFGLTAQQFNIGSQRKRYERMQAEFFDDQKTENHAPRDQA